MMKNKHQIIKVLLLISIYCFGIYLSANSSAYFSEQNVVKDNKQKEYVSTTSKVLFIHTQQYESLQSNLTEYSLPTFESPDNLFWLISNSNELLFNSKFKQYNNYLKNILIRHRKSDLIFPFHNFW
ncbi:hypothetical protein SAMN05216503_2645 [Polaribacter sp. KT25b]|uniref:hypothetical protein n=1 Tax=Polaribacter sp. KT25b TaxID=1855336 RepID=UPI00087DF1B5|nr:hypothetical protein [Polaribacter sp. KT25b]SDS30962.1 hypothetical protein SAMN05216503_2645 [Polaribacter sp. KT25b]